MITTETAAISAKASAGAGPHTAQAMTLDAILDLIRGAGKEPAERDSFYNVIRTFGDEAADSQPMADRRQPTAA